MLYEVWIEDFRIPILPQELQAYEEMDTSSVTIDGKGEITKTTNAKLRTFEISSFFYNPMKQKPHYAKEYTKDINTLEDINQFFHSIQRNNKIVPFKIFGLDIDTTVQIQKYLWSSQDGSSDIYFELSLIEHKEINIESSNEILEKRLKETRKNWE